MSGTGQVWDRIESGQGRFGTGYLLDKENLGLDRFGTEQIRDRIGSGQGVGLDYR